MTNLVMNEKGEVFDSARDIADEIDSQTLLEMHLDSLTFNHLQNVVITEDFIPDIRFGLKPQIRSSAVCCRVSPLTNFRQLPLSFGFEE